MQLRFASFAVINLRWDLHPQECAHAGRTRKSRLVRKHISGLMKRTAVLRIFLVRLERFERPTPWFVAKYSIHLSYSRTSRTRL